MTNPPEAKRPGPRDAAREKRLAEALRANLRRRKAAAKGPAVEGDSPAAARPEDEGRGPPGGAGEGASATSADGPETRENPEESA